MRTMPFTPIALLAAFDLAFASTCGNEKCVADATAITVTHPESPQSARWAQLRADTAAGSVQVEVTQYRPPVA